MVFFLALVIDLFLGLMLMALLVSLKPACLRLTRPFVCPLERELKVRTFSFGSPGAGGRGLEVLAVGPDGSRDVKARALFVFVCMCNLVALPLALYLASAILAAA